MTHQIPRDPQFMSDHSKDAVGCRLRLDWEGMSDEEYLSWERYFARCIDDDRAEELARGRTDYESWMDRIDQIVRMGAGDVRTAIRWDIEACGAQDVDHYCYLNNLAYQMRGEIEEMRRAA
jgi:hypothetical protein